MTSISLSLGWPSDFGLSTKGLFEGPFYGTDHDVRDTTTCLKVVELVASVCTRPFHRASFLDYLLMLSATPQVVAHGT